MNKVKAEVEGLISFETRRVKSRKARSVCRSPSYTSKRCKGVVKVFMFMMHNGMYGLVCNVDRYK